MEKPTAVPHATGSRIAAAGFAKRKLGRVKEGMYDVIVGSMECLEACDEIRMELMKKSSTRTRCLAMHN